MISQEVWTNFFLSLSPCIQYDLLAPSRPGFGAMTVTCSSYLLVPWFHRRAGSPTSKLIALQLVLLPWALSLEAASLLQSSAARTGPCAGNVGSSVLRSLPNIRWAGDPTPGGNPSLRLRAFTSSWTSCPGRLGLCSRASLNNPNFFSANP